MRTFEMLIVFGALMAIIALVAIAIDWVGKPLRNRRFLPRLYRYDDEILPREYLVAPSAPPMPPLPQMRPASMGQAPMPAAAPARPNILVAPAVGPGVAATDHPGVPITTPAAATAAAPDRPAVPVPTPEPSATEVAARANGTKPRTASAFSDRVLAATGAVAAAATSRAIRSREPAMATVNAHATVARSDGAETPVQSWQPGMPLDVRDGDRKPTPAVKATRFWKSVARSAPSSHFDDENRTRMATGKSPRRRNPRTGNLESMQLVGLRKASTESAVRMRWPDDSVDPWSPR